MNISDLRRTADRALSEFNHYRRTAADEDANLTAAQSRLACAQTGQKILQEIAAGVQAAAHEQIARIVSKCLSTVFGADAYEFRVIFEQKRGKTEARLAFVRDGIEYDPTTECGGGVCDVAAFGLRLAALILQHPAVRRLLILDEPAKMLSRDYAPNFRAMLESLADELDVQVVMVTHNNGLACGKIVEIE